MNLKEMRDVDPRCVDRSALRQRSTVRISRKKEKDERVRDYIKQIGNPYCYLDGKFVVKVSFQETDRTIEDCIRGYLSGV